MPIRFEIAGAIARITLNRPEKRNAITQEMIRALSQAVERSEGARLIVFAGAGRDFCSGMDLVELQETTEAGVEKHLEAARALADLYRALRKHPLPVVAAVKGRALGGGCGLATACDVVLASESAHFGYPEVKIGFVPAIVMSMLRRSVGEKRAFELLVSGEPIGAPQALELGLITRVYPDEEFEAGVEHYLAALVAKPSSAVSLTKSLLYNIDSMPFDAAIEAGVQVNALARMTEEARQGFERFTKKDRR